MKRLMCAAMAGITALTSIVMTVPAAAEEKTNRYGDFEYQINGSEVTITKYVGDDSSVYIPDYIDGRKVTQISHSAFALLDEFQNSIEFIRLPAYLEEIDDYSFIGTNLKSIVFPQSLRIIGQEAFEYCHELQEIIFGGNVYLCYAAFQNCTNLQVVSLFTGDNFTYGYQNGYWDKDIFALSDNISSVYYFGTVDKNNYFPCMFDEIGSTGAGCKIYDSINYYAFNNFDYTDQITIQKFDPHDTHALVTFNTNGGDTANTQIYALKGQMVSEAIPPEKKDCEFVGWYDNKACTGEPWDFTTDRVSSDMTLYAKFIPAQYTITFDPQGGTCDTKSGEYSFGQGVGNLPTPTKTNYTFLGWYSRPECGGTKETLIK